MFRHKHHHEHHKHNHSTFMLSEDDCENLCLSICIDDKFEGINVSSSICTSTCMKVCSRGKFKAVAIEDEVESKTLDSQRQKTMLDNQRQKTTQSCPPEANCDVNLDQLSFDELKSLYNNMQAIHLSSNVDSTVAQQNKELSVLKELIEDLATKTSKDDDIVIALEAIVLVLFVCKPIVMYYIQAKYNAPAPHIRSNDEQTIEPDDKDRYLEYAVQA